MSEILLTLAPVFLVIALGHAVRRTDRLPDAFWTGAERLVYWGLFPCLLFRKTATAPLDAIALGPIAVVALGGIAAAAAAALAVRPLLRREPAAFGSVFQASIRMNVYIGLAVCAGLAGALGEALAAVWAGLMVPAVNALSIVALLRLHGGAAGTPGAHGGWGGVLRGLVTHQLILAIAAGFALNAAGLAIPPVLDGVTEILARGALPLALLTVGGGLAPRALAGLDRAVAAAAAIKLLLLPAAAYALARLVALSPEAQLVAIVFAALPASASGYHMARAMGGDAPLMASTITAQTILAALTMPAAILLLAPEL